MSDAAQQEEWVRRAVAGDEVALALLLRENREPLSERLSRRIGARFRGQIEADDLVQESHVEVFRHIGAFRPEGPESFERWVAVIAMRKLRDALRHQRAAKRAQGRVGAGGWNKDDSMMALMDHLATTSRTPSRSAVRGEAVAAVEKAIEALPEDQRRAVRLVHIEGWAVERAAREMGKTERAVHGLTRRGLEAMREALCEVMGESRG